MLLNDEVGDVEATFWITSNFEKPSFLQIGHTNDCLSAAFANAIESEVSKAHMQGRLETWEQTYASFGNIKTVDPICVWMNNHIDSDPVMNAWLLCQTAYHQRSEDKYFVLAIPWWDPVWYGEQSSYITDLQEQESVFTTIVDMKRYESRKDQNRRMTCVLIHNIPGDDITFLASLHSTKESYSDKENLHWYTTVSYTHLTLPTILLV